MKSILKFIYSLINKIYVSFYRFYLKFVGVLCGRNLKIHGLPYILSHGRGKIVLGDNLTLSSGEIANPIGLNHRCIIRTIGKEAEIWIGNEVGISGSTLLARNKIIISDGVLIGANCTIVDSDFHPLDPIQRRKMQTEGIESKPILLEENVWLGMNVIVLKGVTIGKNTIVGAGSVVVKSLPPNVIAAGNPAKVIRNIV